MKTASEAFKEMKECLKTHKKTGASTITLDIQVFEFLIDELENLNNEANRLTDEICKNKDPEDYNYARGM